MGYFTFLCSMLFFLIFFFGIKNKPLHPAALFFGLYSFILFLSLINLYHIYKPTDEAYYLILLMLCSFGIGSINSFFQGIKVRFSGKKKTRNEYQLNLKLFYIFIGISFAISLYDIFLIIQYLRNGVPMWQIRNWTLEEFGSNNPILARRSFAEELFRTIIISPVLMLIPPIAAFVFFSPKYDRKKRKMILILSIIRTLFNSITGGGGRLGFIYFAGCFLISYLMFSNRKKYHDFKKGKNQKYILLFILCAVLFILLATRMRLGTGYVFQQIYTYFALPPTLLSIWLPRIEDVSPTYGILSFYGLFGYPFRTLKMLGLDFLVPVSYDNAFQHILNAQKFMSTGYGIRNAFVTPVYYLLIDGGKPFLCIVSIVLGVITSEIHKEILRNKADIKKFTIYAMMMYGVFISFMTIMTAVPTNILSFVYVQFMFQRMPYQQEQRGK